MTRSEVVPNWDNRTLYRRDNLDVLRGMNSETVDLIATDPPFNKDKDFHATPESLAKEAKFQDRWSWDDDIHQEWVDQIADDWPRVRAAIDAALMTHSDGMGAFLCYMGVRLIEMHRVLKPTGSLYLHCDATASHYLKQLLDAVFGIANFRNEITWKRTTTHSMAKRRFPNLTDSILFHSKGEDYSFNPQYLPLGDVETKGYRHQDTDGNAYTLDNLTVRLPGAEDRRYEFLGVTRKWAYSRERMGELHREGRIIQTKPGAVPRFKRYLKDALGAVVGNVWTDIKVLGAHAKERVGYPTQKPLALYERIIRASSNEGDVVLDPFCGCATTLIAAERLSRQWAGVDIWDGAKEIVLDRLQQEGVARKGECTDRLFSEELTYTEGVPQRNDDWRESVPFLPSKLKQAEPPGPRMSRAEMLQILVERDGIRCQGCFRKFDHPSYLELDHIRPRAEGESNAIDNRTLLCGPCNRTKSNELTLSGLRKKNKQTGFMVQ